MKRRYCVDKAEMKKVEATLVVAQRMGLIESPDLDAVETRRAAKNEEIRRQLEMGELVYGPQQYSSAVYLQYELTRFRLDFTEQLPVICAKYKYREISEEQKQQYYQANQDLFTRYWGDLMPYEDVEAVIEKRLREAEYDELVNDVLCQLL